jgi:hypothetical protein
MQIQKEFARLEPVSKPKSKTNFHHQGTKTPRTALDKKAINPQFLFSFSWCLGVLVVNN